MNGAVGKLIHMYAYHRIHTPPVHYAAAGRHIRFLSIRKGVIVLPCEYHPHAQRLKLPLKQL